MFRTNLTCTKMPINGYGFMIVFTVLLIMLFSYFVYTHYSITNATISPGKYIQL